MSVKGFKKYDEKGNVVGIEKYDYDSLDNIPKDLAKTTKLNKNGLDFGVVGDGVTDDSVAINALLASGWTTVYLPKRTYKISSPILLSGRHTEFICDGTIEYDGEDSAIQILYNNSSIKVYQINAPNGTAVKIDSTSHKVYGVNVECRFITSKIGLHIYANNAEITYGLYDFGTINASEIPIKIESVGDSILINEHKFNIVSLTSSSTAIHGVYIKGAGNCRFLSGAIEGISPDAVAIYVENGEYNTFENFRCMENYGSKRIKLVGFCRCNGFRLSYCKFSEVDTSEMDFSNARTAHNRLYGALSQDGSYHIGEIAEITKNGIIYDITKASKAFSINLVPSSYSDKEIKMLSTGIIPSAFKCSNLSLNDTVWTLSEIYNYGCLSGGSPVTFMFGNTHGKMILKDNQGNILIDNSKGDYKGKTVTVQSLGVDASNVNVWDIKVIGDLSKQVLHVTPEMFGAVGDGVTDDTLAWEQAVSTGNKIVCGKNKTYLITSVGLDENDMAGNAHLLLATGQNIDFNGSTVLWKHPTGTYRCLFVAQNVSNIEISNGVIIGDRETNATEFLHPICLVSSNNIRISNMTIKETGGDGIVVTEYLTSKVPCKNIEIANCHMYHTYRNALSIIMADGVEVHGCKFEYSYGTSPHAGIDIEPNRYYQYCKNIKVHHCSFINNGNRGFLVTYHNNPAELGVTLDTCYFESNGVVDVAISSGATAGATADTKGYIDVRNCVAKYAGTNSITLKGHTTGKVRITFDDFTIIEPNQKGKTVINSGSAVYVNGYAEDDISKNIYFNNIHVIGNTHTRDVYIENADVEYMGDFLKGAVVFSTGSNAKLKALSSPVELGDTLNLNSFPVALYPTYVKPSISTKDSTVNMGALPSKIDIEFINCSDYNIKVVSDGNTYVVSPHSTAMWISSQQRIVGIKPTYKTSELTNDSGFITKAVSDLTNYYSKSQTYSQEEINSKISAIPKFSIEVVSSLPTSNISATTVYLVKSGAESQNLYTEYIYVNGAWEYLGTQTVDLTGYAKTSNHYTKTESDNKYALKSSAETWTFELEDGTTVTKKVVLA